MSADDDPWADHPSLFDDPDVVRAAKHEAIARAGDHADGEWYTAAVAAVRHCAATLDTFTADDVWAVLDWDDDGPTTAEPRALGAVFRAAVHAGVIRKTGTVRPSRFRRRHGRDLTVWTSR